MARGGGSSGRGSRAGRGEERGAAAVEFALVMPILLLLVFGIINYGLWFNESLNVRQGVREAARQAVVRNFDATCTGSDAAKIACGTKKQIGAVTGTSFAKVIMPTTWKRGTPVTVCAMVQVATPAPLIPMPADSMVRSKTQMSVEVEQLSAVTTAHADTLPSGSDWSWCS